MNTYKCTECGAARGAERMIWMAQSGSAIQPKTYSQSPLAEAMVKTWGETTSIGKCTKMLGCGKSTVYKLIEQKSIATNEAGRVITRTAADYIEFGGPAKRRRTPKEATAKRQERSKAACPKFIK